MSQRFEVIESRSELKRIASKLAEESLVAVDIEADSLYHYLPRICLVQFSSAKETFLIDPLATRTLAPLHPLLTSTKTRKVFHGADYDLRSLFREYSIIVNNIFDTMIASQFVGDKEPGLGAVMKHRFDVVLEKKYQKANWSKRPLTGDMLAYAAQDTAHLLKLYTELRKELAAKGRLAWVEEECEHLIAGCTSASCRAQGGGNGPDNTPLFKRFKGAGTMARRDLAVLENILRFRESEAMRQDKPPFKVFGNNLIKTLVTTKPADTSALAQTPKLPRNFMRRYGKGVLAAIREALRLPTGRLPSYPSEPRPPNNPEKQLRLQELKRWRRRCAARLKLQPGLLCNNVLLNLLAERQPTRVTDLDQIPEIRNWQKEAFGGEIIHVLNRGP